MVWEGENVIEVMRQLIGKINFKEVLSGMIWGDYGMFVGKNIIYGFDFFESVECEINIFFKNEELVLY